MQGYKLTIPAESQSYPYRSRKDEVLVFADYSSLANFLSLLEHTDWKGYCAAKLEEVR